MTAVTQQDTVLEIGGAKFKSRLMVGTGKYATNQVMLAAIAGSGAEIVTVAVRRVDLDRSKDEAILHHLDPEELFLLANTAGCYTVEDAVTTAQLGRELLDTSLIKLEVIGDDRTLFPDVAGTLEAAKILLDDGFTVLPYITDDPVACQRLEAMGCPVVMPLAAPIGSGLGIRNPLDTITGPED